MIKAFILIRIKQVIRSAGGLGPVRAIVLLGLIVFLAAGLFIQTTGKPNVYYSAGIYLVIITLIHLSRKDIKFLKIHFNKFKVILLSEYLVLLIPLFICLLYNGQWTTIFCVILLTSALINLEFKPMKRSLNSALQRLIPSGSFEWKSGVRKQLFLIVPLWIAGIITSFFVASVPIVIFILAVLQYSFYEKGEPVQMILAYEMGTSRFLMHKIKIQSALFTILCMPLIVAFLVFHFDKWYIPCIEYLIFLTSHIYVILTKYAFYQPDNKSTGAQIFGAIGALSLVMPVLIPLIWLLSIRFYFKSSENLNFLLNDYN